MKNKKTLNKTTPVRSSEIKRSGKIGILLINLGSPEQPRTGEVRRYLREFLSDPRVIDIPALARFLLLNLFILPFRPQKSARAYREIWDPSGSPLILHTAELARKLDETLNPRGADEGAYQVEYAMRYGAPAIGEVLKRFERAGVERIRILPLYPQYASSSTGSSLEEVYRQTGTFWNTPALEVIPPFYDEPGFIKAQSRIIKENLKSFETRTGRKIDYVLFSFHGLPERQIQKSDCRGSHCLSRPDCCENPGEAIHYCYRAQSYQSARLLWESLKLPPEKVGVSFQSRLGRTPWIKPYTDELLLELPGRGVKNLAVVAPSFTADCLETLEELGIRGRDDFLGAGGEEFLYIPCVNSDPDWVRAVAKMMG